MKVLHIIRNESKVGGVEYHIRYLTREQVKMGLKPVVLSFSSAAENSLTVNSFGGTDWYVLGVGNALHRPLQAIKSLKSETLAWAATAIERLQQNYFIDSKLRLIREIAPDIVHQHDYLSSVRLSWRIQNPIVFTNHYGEYLLLQKSWPTRKIQANFLNIFDSVIAPSRNLLPDGENCHYIPNGFDPDVFRPIDPGKKMASKQNHGAEGKIVFLCARRWAPNKGIIYLARALQVLPDHVKKKVLVLFAGNESEDYPVYVGKVMSELAKLKGIDYRLLGSIAHDELVSVMEMSDIGVIPSVVEGMSLSSVEMIACGIPVLATNVGGLPEIIKEGENGWLVPPKDPGQLAIAITRVVEEWPDRNLKIDTEAFRNEYSWKKAASETLKIYNKLRSARKY